MPIFLFFALMCGIVGYINLDGDQEQRKNAVDAAVTCLGKRGPDACGTSFHKNVGFGHTRLSILDISDAGAQPMYDDPGNYTIIFNGEIYNYRTIREELKALGYSFRSDSDTEVLLKAYIEYGEGFLNKLNGFFALAIHSRLDDTIFIARDRMGIKPLYHYRDENLFVFASEMKALLKFPIEKELDWVSIWEYLQLNYIPGPDSIFKNVKKLLPGHCITIKGNTPEIKQWYKIPYNKDAQTNLSYEKAGEHLVELMDESVKRRLISDVPLGAFLSGGIDSSVITALATRHVSQLNTFSIGFKENKFFDETAYAELVAKKYNTNHTAFYLTNDDLYGSLLTTLDYIDEPFADSSALVVNVLSQYTRKYVTVALSGDGGDELFAGYNKHFGEYRVRRGGAAAAIVTAMNPLWEALPKSRNNAFGNKIRQLSRFAEGKRMSTEERYWRWCSFVNQNDALRLLHPKNYMNLAPLRAELEWRKELFTGDLKNSESLNDVLYADMHLVLPNDMLTKVDLMSMCNSLEVRVPFLDHNVVEFAFSLPAEYKINGKMKKRIVQDAFRDLLPDELYNRPKQGFEVPLLDWLRNELKDKIESVWLNEDYIRSQGIFDYKQISALKRKLYSNNPEDVQARIYGLIVFQEWYRKVMD